MAAVDENQSPGIGAAWSDPLEVKLFALLGMVNDWLKFAETKNGSIVALSSAALALLFGKTGEEQSISTVTWLLVGPGGTCLLLSMLAGLISFFPLAKAPRTPRHRAGAAADIDNLYYFGHLAGYEPLALAQAMNRRYLQAPDGPIGEAAHALASQVVINARITLWKLNLFSFALALFGAGFTLSALGVARMVVP